MTGQAETNRAAGTPVPLLSLGGIVKQFPGCLANDRVDLTVLPGEIHALLGENGAGKSTLVKIIYGVLKPDAGEIRWQGQPIIVQNPNHARRLGIGMVFQHFSLFEALTVSENIALGLTDAADRKGLRDAHRGDRQGLRPASRSRQGGARPLGRRAAAHRDRALPAAEAEAADHGRADLGADAAGGGAPVRDAAPAGARKAAPSSISATSWKRSAPCASAPPSCAWARWWRIATRARKRRSIWPS